MRTDNVLGPFRHTSDDRRRELLSPYIDGELTDGEAREVEQHLASSEDARQELTDLLMAVSLLNNLPTLEASRSFKLEAVPEPEKSPPRWSSLWATGLATSMATMLLVSLVVGDILDVLIQTREMAVQSIERFEQAESAAATALVPASAPTPADHEPRSDGGTEGGRAASVSEPAARQIEAANSVAPTPAQELTDVAPQAATSQQAELVAAAAQILPSPQEDTTQPDPASGEQVADLQARALAAPIDPPKSPKPETTPRLAPVVAAVAIPPASAAVQKSSQSESAREPQAFTAAPDTDQEDVEEPPVVETTEDEVADTTSVAAEFAQQTVAPELASAPAPSPLKTSPSPPSVGTSQAVDEVVEASTVDDQSVASVPVTDDVQAVGALETMGDAGIDDDTSSPKLVASVVIGDRVDLQTDEIMTLDRARKSDNAIELPLRQIQVVAGTIVFLLAATTVVIFRRRRSPVD